MKIAFAGTRYVGLSMATLLSQHHSVVAVDMIPEKVEKINRRESPIQDPFEKMIIMKYDCVGIGVVKMTVGVRRRTHEKVLKFCLKSAQGMFT